MIELFVGIFVHIITSFFNERTDGQRENINPVLLEREEIDTD